MIEPSEIMVLGADAVDLVEGNIEKRSSGPSAEASRVQEQGRRS